MPKAKEREATGTKLLRDTAKKLSVSERKKAEDIYKYITLMGLKKSYDKTDFHAHVARVKDLGGFKDKCGTFYQEFQKIESKIEVVQDMADNMAMDKDIPAGGDKDFADAVDEDAQDNAALLGRHNASKKKIVQNVCAYLKELEFKTI